MRKFLYAALVGLLVMFFTGCQKADSIDVKNDDVSVELACLVAKNYTNHKMFWDIPYRSLQQLK